MSQATLPFDPTPQELSLEAYQSVVDQLPEMRRRVYDYIVSRGLGGATSDEICAALGTHGNTHGRTTELRRLGLIKPVGERLTRSGRRAKVYLAIQPELPLMRQIPK